MLSTISTSASPATGETIPLIAAASSETALSSANGPSMIAPLICPRSPILLMIASSTAVLMSGLTTSIAASIATLGFSSPNACPTATLFCTISILALRSGSMFIAPSDMMNKRSKRPGASKTNACDSSLPVRSPHSLFSTALRIVAVSNKPFISTSALPSRTAFTASSAASALLEACVMVNRASSIPISWHSVRIFCSSPNSSGSIIPSSRAECTASKT